jgi:hypothetical protein
MAAPPSAGGQEPSTFDFEDLDEIRLAQDVVNKNEPALGQGSHRCVRNQVQTDVG